MVNKKTVHIYIKIPFWLIWGCLITFYVYVSLGFKQIPSEEEEKQEREYKHQNSNLHPEDVKNKKEEIICTAFTNYGIHIWYK